MNFLISREQKLEEFLSVMGKKERRKLVSREETVKIFIGKDWNDRLDVLVIAHV